MEAKAVLDDDVVAVIEAAHLCFAATVSADGRPNLSPKGTIRVWDERRIFFLDIASPGTRGNLLRNPAIEINVVEALSRRGYRLSGTASIHRAGEVYDRATKRVFDEEGTTYPVEAVVLIEVERAAPLVSPGYAHVPAEEEMRRGWRKRRSALDSAFEAFLEAHPWRGAKR